MKGAAFFSRVFLRPEPSTTGVFLIKRTIGFTEWNSYFFPSTIMLKSPPPTPKASTFPSSSLNFSAAASMSPSVPMRSMLIFSPSRVTSTALFLLDEPMLMLTALFIPHSSSDEMAVLYNGINLWLQWKREVKSGSHPHFTLDPDSASMYFDDPPHDGKTDPRAFGIRVEFVE